MKPLSKAERTELKKITRKIRTNRATMREVHRAFDLTNRDHAQVKQNQQMSDFERSEAQAEYSERGRWN